MRKSLFHIIKNHPIVTLFFPPCSLGLLISLIVCIIFGFSFIITIVDFVGLGSKTDTFADELLNDLRVSGIVFAMGAVLVWILSKVIKSMLTTCQK